MFPRLVAARGALPILRSGAVAAFPAPRSPVCAFFRPVASSAAAASSPPAQSRFVNNLSHTSFARFQQQHHCLQQRSFASRAVPKRAPSTPVKKGRPTTRYENMLVNDELLKFPNVRIKGADGPLRELPTRTAILEAKGKKLDLVCALLRTDPPICTIEDAAALNFHNQKKLKAAAKAQRDRAQNVKGMRFKGRIMEADLQMKLSQMVKFMEKGDDIQVEIQKAQSEEQAHYVFNRCVVALYALGAPTMPFATGARSFVFKKGAKHQHPVEHFTALMGNLATASQKAIEAQDAARRKMLLERKLARRKLMMERKGHSVDEADEDDSELSDEMPIDDHEDDDAR